MMSEDGGQCDIGGDFPSEHELRWMIELSWLLRVKVEGGCNRDGVRWMDKKEY
jgi:hypothetical protein